MPRPIIGLLLAFFLITTFGTGDESVGRDEAWILWLVRDVVRIEPAAPTDVLRNTITNVRETLFRTIDSDQPPLYALVLDGWTMATGNTAFAARYFSALCVLVALTASYRIFVHMANVRAALPAAILLATSVLFVAAARNVTQYGLLTALITLATLIYLHWRHRPSYSLIFVYFLLLVMALYTDYVALLMIVAHGVIEFRNPRAKFRWLAAVVIAVGTLAPWIVVALDETYWTAILNKMMLALALLLLPLLVELVLSLAERRPREMLSAVWFIAVIQLVVYFVLIPPKPRWLDAMTSLLEVRQPLEPAITEFAPDSPAAYYDEQLDLRHGISLEIGWRRHSPAELQTIVSKVATPDLPVWVMMPTESVQTWDVMSALNMTHISAYHDIVDGMVFYRFDPKAP